MERQSHVTDINDIKKYLWSHIYNNQIYVDMLCQYVTMAFDNYSTDMMVVSSFDSSNMSIKVNNENKVVMQTLVVNALLLTAFTSFIDYLRSNLEINDKEYDICRSRVSMLYNVVLNTEQEIIIKL